MLALITSLARNEATSASLRTLVEDTAGFGGPSDRDTVRRYLDRLTDAFVIEPLGFLFESLVIRDLRVYAQTFGAEAMHYWDSKDLEVDAILTQGAGDWAAVEIKLGGATAIDAAIASLRRMRAKVDTQRAGEPSRLIVVTAVGRVFETNDDIAVVPVTHLRS